MPHLHTDQIERAKSNNQKKKMIRNKTYNINQGKDNIIPNSIK